MSFLYGVDPARLEATSHGRLKSPSSILIRVPGRQEFQDQVWQSLGSLYEVQNSDGTMWKQLIEWWWIECVCIRQATWQGPFPICSGEALEPPTRLMAAMSAHPTQLTNKLAQWLRVQVEARAFDLSIPQRNRESLCDAFAAVAHHLSTSEFDSASFYSTLINHTDSAAALPVALRLAAGNLPDDSSVWNEIWALFNRGVSDADAYKIVVTQALRSNWPAGLAQLVQAKAKTDNRRVTCVAVALDLTREESTISKTISVATLCAVCRAVWHEVPESCSAANEKRWTDILRREVLVSALDCFAGLADTRQIRVVANALNARLDGAKPFLVFAALNSAIPANVVDRELLEASLEEFVSNKSAAFEQYCNSSVDTELEVCRLLKQLGFNGAMVWSRFGHLADYENSQALRRVLTFFRSCAWDWDAAVSDIRFCWAANALAYYLKQTEQDGDLFIWLLTCLQLFEIRQMECSEIFDLPQDIEAALSFVKMVQYSKLALAVRLPDVESIAKDYDQDDVNAVALLLALSRDDTKRLTDEVSRGIILTEATKGVAWKLAHAEVLLLLIHRHNFWTVEDLTNKLERAVRKALEDSADAIGEIGNLLFKCKRLRVKD